MMRQALVKKANQGLRKALSDFLAAPTGGWNARDSLDAMRATDAVILENWMPRQTDLELRGGWAEHQELVAGDVVGTLMTWNGASSSKLFACTSGGIFDASTSGITRPAFAVTLTSGLVSYVNFATAGGHFLLAVNGADSLKRFDGTTWLSVTDTSTPAITGVPTADLSSIAVAHRRLWFTRKNSSSVYYLDAGAIAGALTEFPLGPVFPLGGTVVAIDTWSSDAGEGADDYTVFVSSEGELAVYVGSDPSTADGFRKIGVFRVARPIGGFRCLAKYGGDLAYLCELGLYPVSKLLSARDFAGLALTDKIDEAFTFAVKTYRNNPAWQIIVYPQQQALIVNVPITVGYNEQFVMNMLTGAWTHFIGWDSACLAVFGGELFGGGREFIQHLWSGVDDNGNLIASRAQLAYNYFGHRGRLKHVKMLSPALKTDGSYFRSVAVDVDFQLSGARDYTFQGIGGFGRAVWGTATWDQAVWGGSLVLTQDWVHTAAPIGYAHSVLFETQTNRAGARWLGFKVMGELGGIF